jgi:hypothetical protein
MAASHPGRGDRAAIRLGGNSLGTANHIAARGIKMAARWVTCHGAATRLWGTSASKIPFGTADPTSSA